MMGAGIRAEMAADADVLSVMANMLADGGFKGEGRM